MFPRSDPPARPEGLAWLGAALLVLALTGCASPGILGSSGAARDETAVLVDRMMAADIVLLGELHDQPHHHRQRLLWLKKLAEHRSIAIVMEQFDARSQPALDRARADASGVSLSERAQRVAEAAGFDFKGWEWHFYGPVVELAIDRQLPLLAGNLARDEAMRIAMGQPHPLDGPPPRGWSEQAEASLARAIDDGHCGVLPQRMIGPMVRAQRARDAQLAEVILAARAAGRLPVLLAGNEHLRRDHGVPIHLVSRAPDLRIFSVALIEQETEAPAAAFDAVWRAAPVERPDPCGPLRERFGKGASADRVARDPQSGATGPAAPLSGVRQP
jgi:uncharacterized iron-regulated protein